MSHIRLSARAIIIHDGKILLNHRPDSCTCPGYCNFPGGGIEQDETAKQAVVREVLEETGYHVTVGEMVFALEYEPKSCGYSINGQAHTQAHNSYFFRCYLDETKPRQEPTEKDNPGANVAWFDLSELDVLNLVPRIAEPLLEYTKTGTFSPLFWSECEHL